MTFIFTCKLFAADLYESCLSSSKLGIAAASYLIYFSVLLKGVAFRATDVCSNVWGSVVVAVDIRLTVFWNVRACSLVERFWCTNYVNFMSVSGVPRNFVPGGFNKFSWGPRTERTGIWGRKPLVRGSGGSCNLVQEISFHIVKFS